MGQQSKRLFTERKDLNRFIQELIGDIKALERMLQDDMFEKGVQRIGVEQELCLLDNRWRPAPIVMEVLEKIDDPHFTTEHSKYNLEINLEPLVLEGTCFSQCEQVLLSELKKLETVLNNMDATHILTGILPTIRRSDLELTNLTPLPRYHLLNDILNKLKGGPYEFRIEGIDELITRHNSIMFEGCNTSFQVHLQVAPQDFIEQYNWALALAGPTLAAATNSPLLLGKRLWHETRIALFQQSIDIRNFVHALRERLPRVTFGNRWMTNSVAEIFTEDIARHRVVIGMETGRPSLDVLKDGEIPKLKALQVHNGTIYKWIRPCYGITDGKPHLRIENRVLPAGPSPADEMANAAFWIGAMLGMPGEYGRLPEIMPFEDAYYNFYKASRIGLDAQFMWPGGRRIPSEELICKELLPIARKGLEKGGINSRDIDYYLGIIEERVTSGQTGSFWALDSYRSLRPKSENYEACVAITAAMVNRQMRNLPIHEWTPAKLEEAGKWINKYWKASQIMQSDFISVRPDDLVSLAVHLMRWKRQRYLPVENEEGNLVGLVTSSQVVEYFSNDPNDSHQDDVIEKIMIREPLSVEARTPSLVALKMMRSAKVGCLPVVQENRLVGLITDQSFINLSEESIQRLFRESEEV